MKFHLRVSSIISLNLPARLISNPRSTSSPNLDEDNSLHIELIIRSKQIVSKSYPLLVVNLNSENKAMGPILPTHISVLSESSAIKICFASSSF